MELRGEFTLSIPDFNGREIFGRGEIWGECDNNNVIFYRTIDDIQHVEFEYLEDSHTAEDMLSEIGETIRQGILEGSYSDFIDYDDVWVENEEDYEHEQSLEEQAMEDYYREIAWGL